MATQELRIALPASTRKLSNWVAHASFWIIGIGCGMAIAAWVPAAVIITGVLGLGCAVFINRVWERPQEERGRENAEWLAKLNRWESSLLAVRKGYRSIGTTLRQHERTWHGVFSAAGWPRGLHAAPAKDWQPKNESDRAALELATRICESGELWLARLHISRGDVIEELRVWVALFDTHELRSEIGEQVEWFKALLIATAFLEIALAKELDSPGQPESWSRLGQQWSELLGPETAVT